MEPLNMHDDVGAAGVEATVHPAPVVFFDVRRGELAGLLFRNLLLTLSTLGIYRFWAKTRVRGFLWRHVRLLDEPLEYLGTGTELLIGFLIAVVFIAPLTTVYSWLPSLVPQSVPYGVLILQAVYYGTLGFLVQVAVYRVRRYRLTRTAWRGVRFGLDGSAFRYALIGSLYGLATLATAGLAYPWLRVATTRYFAGNARFGTTRFSFEGGTVRLFLRWLVVMAPTLAAVLLFFLVNEEALTVLWKLLRDPEFEGPSFIAAAGRFNFAPLGLVLVSAVVFPWYRVSEFRHLVNAARIGGNRLQSRMDAGSVYGVYLVFYICVFGAALFAALGVFGVLQIIIKESGLTVNPALGFFFGLLVAGSGYWLYGLARTLMVDVSLLALACDTLSVQEPEALERTVQSAASLPGHGEGLADALDVGGF